MLHPDRTVSSAFDSNIKTVDHAGFERILILVVKYFLISNCWKKGIMYFVLFVSILFYNFILFVPTFFSSVPNRTRQGKGRTRGTKGTVQPQVLEFITFNHTDYRIQQ